MANILKKSDFENGPFTIPLTGEQEADFDILIPIVERECLVEMFGVELYLLFKADVDANAGVPVITRFVTVFNAFLMQPDTIIYDSKGIKEMLKAFVYYEWGKDMPSRLTTIAVKQVKGENSDNVSALALGITIKYNGGVETYCAIQWFMDDEDAVTYPEYDGIPKPFNHPY